MTALPLEPSFGAQVDTLPRLSSSSAASSQPSSKLNGRPLNFSRPLQRLAPSTDASSRTSEEYGRTSSEWSNDEDAAPPPIIRTHANLNDQSGARLLSRWGSDGAAAPRPTTSLAHANSDRFDMDSASIADSVDDAIPPPIKTRTATNGSSSYQNQVQRLPPSGSDSTPRTILHNPYTASLQDQRMSIASTAETDESYDTFDTYDTERESISDDDDGETSRRSIATARSSVSDFTFDGQMGRDPHLPSLAEAHSQRWIGLRRPVIGTSSTQTTQQSSQSDQSKPSQQTESMDSSKPLLKTVTQESSSSEASRTGSSTAVPPKPAQFPKIVKRVSLDQISEHVNPMSGQNMSDRGSISSNEWNSSECDTSVLSVEKIHKLKKKGINPALYLEMKNARKGKGKWANPLGGSSFLA